MKFKKYIPLSEPHLFGNEKKYIYECIKTQWISSSGKYVNLFEKSISKKTRAKYAVACINGTSALQLSLRILNPERNDEVIVPSITFVSSINSLIYNNCRPIFMDCDDYLNIDIEKTIEFINTKTKMISGSCYNKNSKKKIIAIVVVHVFGNSVDLNNKFIKLCRKKNIRIIEDAAESVGTYYKYNGKKNHSGTIGDLGCLSFNGNKIATSGGGGMILTKNKSLFSKAKYLSTQAKDNANFFIHNEVGFNFRLSNIHSAIGKAQIEKLNIILKKKKRINIFYKKEINKIKGLKIMDNPSYSDSNNWLNILFVDEKRYGLSKNMIMKKFIKHGIEARSVWYPNHMQKPFLKFEKYKIYKAYNSFKKSLCLPSSFGIKKNELNHIVNILKTR